MAASDGWPYPPNSLEAISAALEGGATFIEIDVTALAEGDYLLVHDPVLESETTGNGVVGALRPESVSDLRIVFNGAPTAYRVPLLSEVVALLLTHGGTARLQCDYKNIFPFEGDEPLARIARLLAPLGSRALVSSGADWQLRALHRCAPTLDLGLDVHFYLDWQAPGAPRHPLLYPKNLGAYGYYDDHPLASARFWPTAQYLADRCAVLVGQVPGASTFYINYRMVLQGLDDGFNWAEALHAHGLRLDCWTFDAKGEAWQRDLARLVTAGVDLITTNTPNALAAALMES
jgi:glycerophosphoryl diester phosphodiesterase